jgi:hypothetical protein
MHALFNLFLDICLFRKGPQEVPASPVLLKLSLITYGLSGLVVMWVINTKLSTALLQTLLDLVLLVGMTYGVLQMQGFGARFGQTMTALLGTGTLLGLMALPVVIWMGEAATDDGMTLPWFLFYLLLGWSIAVMAHVLQHALSTTRAIAMLYALGYMVISGVLSSFLAAVS